jgi:CheY-like chemotaxis protein
MVDEFGGNDVDFKPMNVLLIEDDEADVKIAIRAFNKADPNINIFVANDGEEALDYIYHRGNYQEKERFPRPDIILLDIKMPKVDGFGVLANIKNNPNCSFIPVVMLTSSKNEQDITRSYKEGACSYIQKPVNYEDFVKIIDGFIFYWQAINRFPK